MPSSRLPFTSSSNAPRAALTVIVSMACRTDIRSGSFSTSPELVTRAAALCMQKSGLTGVTGQSECSSGLMPACTAEPTGSRLQHAVGSQEPVTVPVAPIEYVVGEEVGNHAKLPHLVYVLGVAHLAVLDAEAVVGLGDGPQRILVGYQRRVYRGVAIRVGRDLVAPLVQGHHHLVQFFLLVDEPALLAIVAEVRLAQRRRYALYRAVGHYLATGDPNPTRRRNRTAGRSPAP